MHRSGILILTNHISALCHGDVVKHIVAGIKDIVCSTLYVHVANTSPQVLIPPSSLTTEGCLSTLLSTEIESSSCQNGRQQVSSDVFPFLSNFYAEAAKQCRNLDVNILLHSFSQPSNIPFKLSRNVQCIIADCNSATLRTNAIDGIFQKFVQSLYIAESLPSSLPLLSIPNVPVESYSKPDLDARKTVSTYGNVVIGGTYDNIHAGHKVLLSEALLLADKRLLIGLTDGEMLERKTLSDMIMPWEQRCKQLSEFLCDIAPFELKAESSKKNENMQKKTLEIVRITDPIGPASTDPDMQCIVASKETERGGSIVNSARVKNGLNSLHIHLIGQGGLIGDAKGASSPPKEVKFSSSTIRYNSLGTLRRCPNKPGSNHPNKDAYVIGLTGGIASGKSSVAKHLSGLGAMVVDCDQLGHAAYEPNTKPFRKVVERFGADVVSPSGTIDRKKLAEKVFTPDPNGKHSNLDDLNAIVWPEIERLARVKIDQAVINSNRENNEKVVCVLDAAVLLEAGWDNFTDEVWVCIIPAAEAVKRIKERDGRSDEEAKKRIEAQMSGKEKAKQAHVILSTFWEPEVTSGQVKKAWSLLHERSQLGGNRIRSSRI